MDRQLTKSQKHNLDITGILLRSKLTPLQISIIKWMETHSFGIIAAEMGSGKTLIAIARIAQSHKHGSPSLFVTPPDVIPHILKEFSKHTLIIKDRPLIVYTPATSGGPSRREAITFPNGSIVITSHSILRADSKIDSPLFRTQFGDVFYDEAQYLSNPKTVGNNSTNLISGEFTWALTGTPFNNHPNIEIIGYRIMLTHNSTSSLEGDHWYAENHIDATVDSSTLPNLIKKTITLEMTPDQWYAHYLYCTSAAKKIQEIKLHGGRGSNANILALITNLRLICAGVINESIQESNKLSWISEFVSKMPEGDKVVIFSSFSNAVLTNFYNVISEDIQAFLCTGEIIGSVRAHNIDTFRTTKNKAALFINYKIGSVGLDLTCASNIILIDPPWNQSTIDQSVKRCHRYGQTRDVTTYSLFSDESAELWMEKHIARKHQYIQEFTGKQTESVTPVNVSDLFHRYVRTVDSRLPYQTIHKDDQPTPSDRCMSCGINNPTWPPSPTQSTVRRLRKCSCNIPHFACDKCAPNHDICCSEIQKEIGTTLINAALPQPTITTTTITQEPPEDTSSEEPSEESATI